MLRIYLQQEGIPFLRFVYECEGGVLLEKQKFLDELKPFIGKKMPKLTFYLETKYMMAGMRKFFTLESLLCAIDATDKRVCTQRMHGCAKRKLELLEESKRVDEEEREWAAAFKKLK